MTNEVTPSALPKPSPVFQQALGANPQESLAEGIGASYGVIHYQAAKHGPSAIEGIISPLCGPDDGTPVKLYRRYHPPTGQSQVKILLCKMGRLTVRAASAQSVRHWMEYLTRR